MDISSLMFVGALAIFRAIPLLFFAVGLALGGLGFFVLIIRRDHRKSAYFFKWGMLFELSCMIPSGPDYWPGPTAACLVGIYFVISLYIFYKREYIRRRTLF